MNIIAQEARKRQAVVKLARRKGKSFAAQKYGVSLSSVKRWDKKYDGKDWRSLMEGTHRPHSHPKRHTEEEEMIISKAFWKKYERYGWDGVYEEAKENGYTRSLSGMIYAAKRLDLVDKAKERKKRRHDRRFPELLKPGEKVQIDVNHFAKKKKRVWYVSRMVGIRAGARRAEGKKPPFAAVRRFMLRASPSEAPTGSCPEVSASVCCCSRSDAALVSDSDPPRCESFPSRRNTVDHFCGFFQLFRCAMVFSAGSVYGRFQVFEALCRMDTPLFH